MPADKKPFLLTHLPLFLILNAYAYLVLLAALLCGGGSWWLFACSHWILGGCLAIAALVSLVSSANLFSQYPVKRRMFFTLTKANQPDIRPGSFQNFINAPCHRLVVRTVLARLGKISEYPRIVDEFWGTPGFCRPVESKVTIFKTPEEGATWLKKNATPDFDFFEDDK